MSGTRHVVLLGLMASGKSTIGQLLARRLDRVFLDNDVVLQDRTGQTAREIESAVGADGLHRREAEVLVASLHSLTPAVIGAAAAAPLEPHAAAALHDGDVFAVYLHVEPEVLAGRLRREPDDGHRPFAAADALALLSSQYAARDPRYRELATIVVEAGELAPESVVEEISSALGV